MNETANLNEMKRILTFTSLISCFCIMLLSCSSIITHKPQNVQTSAVTQTTPQSTVITTIVTLPPWSSQTGNHVIDSHSGYVMTNIYERSMNDQNENLAVYAKILSPEVIFYNNESLQNTVNANLLYVSNEIKAKVDSICQRYVDADVSSYLTTPNVLVDYSLEYYTKEAMSLKFQFTETDNNAMTHVSYLTYNLDLTTGSIINSAMMFNQSDLNDISSLVAQKLSENGYTIFQDGKALVEKYFANRWYIEFEKLNLSFNPGEIAAISEGGIEISLSLEEISPMLSQYGKALFTVKYEDN